MQKIWGLLLCLILMLSVMPSLYPSPVLASDPTTTITVTKYASDGTTILGQRTVDVGWMEANLPVQGNGTTHYYHQGPTFDTENLWDPGEMVNIDSRDMGAVMGTDVKDLCDLPEIGGASSGDVIKIKSPDGFNKSFAYEDVYAPEPEQGKMVITWYRADDGLLPADGYGYPPDYVTGMRLVFFAQTQNPEGKYVFGDWDMHETLAEDYWHYYYDGTLWPSSSGLSVKWVSDIIIYSSESAGGNGGGGDASASLTATANVIIPTAGISLDRVSIDYGNIGPGDNSAIETVGITNSGTLDIDVTLEVEGVGTIAQDFYEQSLYIDDNLYDINQVIASIGAAQTEYVDTQVKVPASWSHPGAQDATFIFWAEAAD